MSLAGVWGASWRDTASKCAARESGFAYDGYVQSKVLSVLGQMTRIIIRMAGIQVERSHEQRLQRALEDWAREKQRLMRNKVKSS